MMASEQSIEQRPQGKVAEMRAGHTEKPSILTQLGTIEWLPHEANGRK